MFKGLAMRLLALLLVASIGVTLPGCAPQPRGGDKEEKGDDKEKKKEEGGDKEKKEDKSDDKEKKEES